jgi:mono/diheme cytochrome c family protein
MKRALYILTTLFLLCELHASTKGEQLFKEYCWGCHHQTSMAFGPSFKQIANTRNEGEIISQIIDPKNTYKQLGFKRNAMPAFDDLSMEEVQELVKFIQSFKD